MNRIRGHGSAPFAAQRCPSGRDENVDEHDNGGEHRARHGLRLRSDGAQA
jgi:hypothetical protein